MLMGVQAYSRPQLIRWSHCGLDSSPELAMFFCQGISWRVYSYPGGKHKFNARPLRRTVFNPATLALEPGIQDL